MKRNNIKDPIKVQPHETWGGRGGLQATECGVLKSSPTSILHISTYLSDC